MRRHQVKVAVLLPKVVHRHDGRVGEARSRLRSLQDLLLAGWVFGEAGFEQLERHQSFQIGIGGPVNGAAAAIAEVCLDFILFELLTYVGIHRILIM